MVDAMLAEPPSLAAVSRQARVQISVIAVVATALALIAALTPISGKKSYELAALLALALAASLSALSSP